MCQKEEIERRKRQKRPGVSCYNPENKMNKMKRNKALSHLLIVVLSVITLTGMLASCSGGSAENKNAERIPILTYHKIVPAGTEFETSLLIAEDTFDEQMKYLHDNGFTTLTLDEFYDWYKGDIEVPEKSVVVTFDDGYYGTYYLAYPIIKKYDQAATVFCIGHHIDEVTAEWDPNETEDHYICADVIEEMRQEYPRFSFESHTFNMHKEIDDEHPVNVFTYDQMMEDAEQNAAYDFKYLAYPWGDYNDTLIRALKDSGYKMAFSYRPFYYATRSDDQYAVNRIKIGGKMELKEFKKIVNGKDKEYINPDA